MHRNRTRLSAVIIIIVLLALFSVGAIDSQVAASTITQFQQTAAAPDQDGGGEISAKSDSIECRNVV